MCGVSGANLVDQLLKLINAVHLSDDDWTRVLRVMPNKLLKNHPFRPLSPLHGLLSGIDRQGLRNVQITFIFRQIMWNVFGVICKFLVLDCALLSLISRLQFLADRTNGRAYATLLRPSVVVVCRL